MTDKTFASATIERIRHLEGRLEDSEKQREDLLAERLTLNARIIELQRALEIKDETEPRFRRRGNPKSP